MLISFFIATGVLFSMLPSTTLEERRALIHQLTELAINDTHGHAFGDEVLKMFAQGSTSVLRPGDLLGRIGGEEFALLLPRTELAAATQVVQRLLDKIAGQVTTTADGTNVRVTVSAGLTEAVAGAPLSTLFHEADQALYQAKNAGRNRVWAFQSVT